MNRKCLSLKLENLGTIGNIALTGRDHAPGFEGRMRCQNQASLYRLSAETTLAIIIKLLGR